MDLTFEDDIEPSQPIKPLKPSEWSSPPPSAALKSAKLAALHARLALPPKLPLQTMARTLVDPSADPNPRFNNASLSQVGAAIISYHVSEFLLCTYPRLPMTVLFAAAYAYNGPATLTMIGREWGVEPVAYPGSEVDPGFLQFSRLKSGAPLPSGGGSTRPDKFEFFRRGISSRNVYDDEFGDLVPKENVQELAQPAETAYSNFVKAVVGSIFLHGGRAAAKKFVKDHVLSRQLNVSNLFRFDDPVRELLRLCQREEFEPPVARILSETGRHSRSPVFVVGIYSGADKLGEGSGPMLVEARLRASVNALKAWYLYSPGKDARVPSEMEDPGAKGWDPVHIDLGEIIH
jgi:dsRNA-specific ribonuclease